MFRLFDDPSAMILQLSQELDDYKNNRKLSGLCRKVERFASAFAPFFDVIGIFVQSNPEFAALAWGAIRLVFLVGGSRVLRIIQPLPRRGRSTCFASADSLLAWLKLHPIS